MKSHVLKRLTWTCQGVERIPPLRRTFALWGEIKQADIPPKIAQPLRRHEGISAVVARPRQHDHASFRELRVKYISTRLPRLLH
jgi:hypothetical protein